MVNLIKRSDARAWSIVAVLSICFSASAALAADPEVADPEVADPGAGLSAPSALDQGFAGLYNLDFAGAQKDFTSWEVQHPDDPVGPVSEAAGFLFSEFNRLGVLESQFFESDQSFQNHTKLSPDPEVH